MNSFGSIGEDLQEWKDLDQKSKDLYAEALKLVQESDNTARLREIFEKNDLDINKSLVPVYGETLLYQATEKENLPMVKALLELGADPKVQNGIGGETPIGWFDDPESEPRNETQQQIHKLLLSKVVPKACSKCGKTVDKVLICSRCKRVRYCSKECQKAHWKGHKPTCKPKVEPDFADAFKNATWAVEEDPEEIQRMQDSDDFIRNMYARQVNEKALYAIQNESPENLEFLAERNKKRRADENIRAELSEEQRALIKEAFEILDITDEDELNYESPASLVARIKEIYSKPGMDVNFPSQKGDRLLAHIVRNYCLEEEDPNAPLELVKLLLEKGADPNLEDELGETALDYMDYEIEVDEVTPQQSEVMRLLKEAGGLIQAYTDDGTKYGERGDTVGRHEEERLKRLQQQMQES